MSILVNLHLINIILARKRTTSPALKISDLRFMPGFLVQAHISVDQAPARDFFSHSNDLPERADRMSTGIFR